MERGVGLLTVGQLLYLLRDAIPDLIAWWATGEERFLSASLLVFETDILTFAGLAFLLLALLKRLKLSDGAILGLGLGMNVAALLLFQVFQTTGSFLADQVLGLFVVTACYFIIEWNEKHLHFGIVNLEGKRRVAVYTAVWLASVAVFAYAYPQVHEYATFWTDYLMG